MILAAMLLTYDLPTAENMQVEWGGEFEACYLYSGVNWILNLLEPEFYI